MNIKEIREKTGLSQSQFAKRFHLSPNTLRNWEQGRRQAPDYVLYLINRVIELEDDGIIVAASAPVTAPKSGRPRKDAASSVVHDHTDLKLEKPESFTGSQFSISRHVKYYQLDVFYEDEIRMWKENKWYRGKPLQTYLYDNRYKYIGKTPEELTDIEILRGFRISGIYRGHTAFDVSLMAEVLTKYNIKSVYDPCAGWGERMLCCFSHGVSYTGVDINDRLEPGYNNMINEMGITGCEFKVGDSSTIKADDKYEAVITCPPYYNVEHYSGKGSENFTYGEFLDWWKKVVNNSITDKTKYFCFQINQKYRDDMSRIVEDAGLFLVDALTYKTNRSSHFTRKKGGVNTKTEFESMLVFMKV